jgi:hypothetical protein
MTWQWVVIIVAALGFLSVHSWGETRKYQARIYSVVQTVAQAMLQQNQTVTPSELEERLNQ